MYATVKTLSVLALAGSVLAAPAVDSPTKVQRRGGWGEWKWGGWGGRGGNGGTPAAAWTNWAATATVYVTADAPAPSSEAPAPTPAPETPAPATGGQFYGAPPSPPAAPAPAPAPASSPAAGSAPANDGSWQSVVAEYRSKGGLGPLTPDSKLTANAQKTADESVGGLKHQLNPGSMGQVLAPGDADDFFHVYVGGWLCEIPTLPGLDGICAEESKGWAYQGQTGHAEILTSTKYTKIGCAHSSRTGVWSCDVA